MTKTLLSTETSPAFSLTDRLHQTAEAMATHIRLILWVGGTLILCAAAYLIWSSVQEGRNQKAADAFETALQQPERRKALEAFLSQHGSTSVAPIAEIYLGRSLLDEMKYTEAAAAFHRAAKINAPYRYFAQEGEAKALDQAKKWPEAIALLSGLAAAEDNPLRALHTWHLGLVQEEAGKTKEALETYRGFETRFQDSPLLAGVRGRIALLRRGKPVP